MYILSNLARPFAIKLFRREQSRGPPPWEWFLFADWSATTQQNLLWCLASVCLLQRMWPLQCFYSSAWAWCPGLNSEESSKNRRNVCENCCDICVYLFHDHWGYLLQMRPRRRTIIFARFEIIKQLFQGYATSIRHRIAIEPQHATHDRCASFARVGPCLAFAASSYWCRRWVLFCSRWSIISFHGSSFQSNLRRGTCHHESYLQTC